MNNKKFGDSIPGRARHPYPNERPAVYGPELAFGTANMAFGIGGTELRNHCVDELLSAFVRDVNLDLVNTPVNPEVILQCLP